jgi:hypothetical protein
MSEQHLTESLAFSIVRSPPESVLMRLHNHTMLACEEICYGVTEYLEALLLDQRGTGKCKFFDI